MIDANSEVFAIKDSNEFFRDGVCVALEECPPRLRSKKIFKLILIVSINHFQK